MLFVAEKECHKTHLKHNYNKVFGLFLVRFLCRKNNTLRVSGVNRFK